MDPDPAASHKTQSSNLASTNAAIEDDDAKDANISTDVASLASQMPSEDVDLTAASAVRAKKGTQDFSESESELVEDVDTPQRVISTASWKLSPQ